MEDIGNSHEKSHDQIPGGQSCIQPFLPNNITMQSMDRMSWSSQILPAPSGPLGPCWPCVSIPPELLSASQPELKSLMHGETEKLLELKRELEKEMERISEDFISSHYMKTERYLDQIRDQRNTYQDEIEDFVDMYTAVLEDTSVLLDWTKEVREIVSVVSKHANVIRTRVLELDPNFYIVKSINTKLKSSAGRVNSSCRLKKNLPAPRNSSQEPSLLKVSEAGKD